jgi:hypothetical protein
MVVALVCSEADLGPELQSTALCRDAIELERAQDVDEARRKAVETRPGIVLVDRDADWALSLVRGLRQDAATRNLSLAVLARDDFDPIEVELLEVGANGVLRLPPDANWDVRLQRLIDVPMRREARFPVRLEVEARSGVRASTATVINLSVNGLLMESAVKLRVGTDVDLRFALPEEPEPILGTAQVVRIAGRSRYGLEFYGLEGEGGARVRRFVSGETAAAPGPGEI